MTSPILLCGLGRLGWNVLGYLRAAGLKVVVIDHKPRPMDSRLRDVAYFQGDIRDRALLEQAGLGEARGVILGTSDDLANIAAALQIRSLHPQVRIVIRMFNQNLLARLGKAVHNIFALSVSALTAPVLALIALTGEALGSFASGNERYQVSEITLDAASPWVGRSVVDFCRDGPCKFLGVGGPGSFHPWHQLPPDRALRAGDRLFLCGEPAQLAPLMGPAQEEDLPRWAGALRRFGRVLWRTLTEIDTALKVCLLVLFLIVGGSTLVYHHGMGYSVPDGIYRTIAVLSAGDLGGEVLVEGWQKVFVGMLHILGVALMAAFTAIVTNYLLRARLGGVLELRRIPEGGHIVVCGLGNIGFRVTEELIRQGQPVVVLESDPAGRFVTTARQLGAAVIHGDATVAEVHRQANTARARAVVAATNAPLVNLEIALLARELNPRQRVVVRMTDPNLAQTLREAAGIDLAFSTTALAAPAFVAALFGDRVLNIFLIEGRVLAVIDLVIEEGDVPLIGARVGGLAEMYQAFPLRLMHQGKKGEPKGDHSLAVGDQLMVILELPNLGRLLSRAAAS